MPANLTPQYLEAEARFRSARSHDEKLAALEEMLALLPKHKGTEKLQADIRRRISRLKEDSQKKSAGARHADPFLVKREGAGQVVLLGPPNAGKSSLVARLTRAEPEVADYPFTTRHPLPGMMRYENVLIQIVDSPPLSEEFMEPGMATLWRAADLLAVVADLGSDDPLTPIEVILSRLEGHGLRLAPPEPVEAEGAKRAVWVANKIDLPGASENLQLLAELLPRPWLVLSASTGQGTGEFAQVVFRSLGVIRIYTKPPGKKADLEDPTVLKRGSTVLDAAAAVHKDFASRLRFARIWGSERFEGQMVERDHVLSDGDIVEFHV